MSDTPVADLIADLLSQGVPRDSAVTAGRKLEAALAAAPRGRRTLEAQRQYERDRKARYRAANPEKSPGQKTSGISSSNTHKSMKEVSKQESSVPPVPGTPTDDWPEDFGDLFWAKYPEATNGRKRERAKVYAKLERLRREGYLDHAKQRRRLTWAELIGGLDGYLGTKPDPQYVPAPIVWLNGQRWNANYTTKGANNGNGSNVRASGVSPTAEAAARRFGGGGRNGHPSGPSGSVPPSRRLDDEAERARASGHPAFQSDDGLGPERPVRR